MGTAGLGIAGAVRLRLARRGVVWQGPVEQGMVRNRRQGSVWCGTARSGVESQARPVAARLRGVCPGVVGHRRQRTARFGLERYGIAGSVRRGLVWRGKVSQATIGVTRFGKARNRSGLVECSK